MNRSFNYMCPLFIKGDHNESELSPFFKMVSMKNCLLFLLSPFFSFFFFLSSFSSNMVFITFFVLFNKYKQYCTTMSLSTSSVNKMATYLVRAVLCNGDIIFVFRIFPWIIVFNIISSFYVAVSVNRKILFRFSLCVSFRPGGTLKGTVIISTVLNDLTVTEADSGTHFGR